MARGSSIAVLLVGLFGMLALAGCRTGRYELEEPLDGRTLEVKSGDRISVELDERTTEGYHWFYTCDDPDIVFARETIEPDENTPAGTPGRVRFIARVVRGFDGPATIRFTCREPRKGGKIVRQIDLILYHTAEDRAPWRNVY